MSNKATCVAILNADTPDFDLVHQYTPPHIDPQAPNHSLITWEVRSQVKDFLQSQAPIQNGFSSSVSTPQGMWYIICRNQMVHCLLVGEDFSPVKAHAIVRQLTTQVDLENNVTNLDKQIEKALQSEPDKIVNAHAQVAEVAGMMQNNLNQIMSNQADVDEMAQKSESLKDGAFKFQSQAKRLEQETARRQKMLYFITVVLMVSLVTYIVMPIVIHVDDDD